MKKLVVIFGPPAVGKMTVGYELSKISGLKLLHNHMTIDLVLQFFDWGSEQFKLSSEFRRRIFEEVAASDLEGLIFTFVWDVADPKEKNYIDGMCEIFKERGADLYFVELYATQSERLLRNESEFRLQQKSSKRNIKESRHRLIQSDKDHTLNTDGEFYYNERYLKIDNTELSAREVAHIVSREFEFNIDSNKNDV